MSRTAQEYIDLINNANDNIERIKLFNQCVQEPKVNKSFTMQDLQTVDKACREKIINALTNDEEVRRWGEAEAASAEKVRQQKRVMNNEHYLSEVQNLIDQGALKIGTLISITCVPIYERGTITPRDAIEEGWGEVLGQKTFWIEKARVQSIDTGSIGILTLPSEFFLFPTRSGVYHEVQYQSQFADKFDLKIF